MTFAKPKRVVNRKLLEAVRKLPCAVCGSLPSDASHIKTRGSGGPDTEFNVFPKCRRHHIEWGRRGALEFCKRYPNFGRKLLKAGWRWDGVRLRHPELEAK